MTNGNVLPGAPGISVAAVVCGRSSTRRAPTCWPTCLAGSRSIVSRKRMTCEGGSSAAILVWGGSAATRGAEGALVSNRPGDGATGGAALVARSRDDQRLLDCKRGELQGTDDLFCMLHLASQNTERRSRDRKIPVTLGQSLSDSRSECAPGRACKPRACVARGPGR